MSTITIFSKKKRNIGDTIVIANKERNNNIIGIITEKCSDNPKYQNHRISVNRMVNTGKDYYLVDIKE